MLSSEGEALMPGTAARNTSGVSVSRHQGAGGATHAPRRRELAHAVLAHHAQRGWREVARESQGASVCARRTCTAARAGAVCAVRSDRHSHGRVGTRTWLAQQALNLLRAVATPRSVARSAVCVTVGTAQARLDDAPRQRAVCQVRHGAGTRAACGGEPPPAQASFRSCEAADSSPPGPGATRQALRRSRTARCCVAAASRAQNRKCASRAARGRAGDNGTSVPGWEAGRRRRPAPREEPPCQRRLSGQA